MHTFQSELSWEIWLWIWWKEGPFDDEIPNIPTNYRMSVVPESHCRNRFWILYRFDERSQIFFLRIYMSSHYFISDFLWRKPFYHKPNCMVIRYTLLINIMFLFPNISVFEYSNNFPRTFLLWFMMIHFAHYWRLLFNPHNVLIIFLFFYFRLHRPSLTSAKQKISILTFFHA